MSEYCDNFKMMDDGSDSFQFWQGLRGPYFTPYVDEQGNLSWTNNGGLPNPETKNIQGKGIQLSGYAASVDDLPEDAQRGDCWAVGTEDPLEAYAWFDGWADLGPMFPPGPPGQDGQDGADGQGVPTGGSAGQVLKKVSGTDFDTEWDTLGADDVGYDGSQSYTAGTAGKKIKEMDADLTLTENGVTPYIVGNTNTTGVTLDPGTYVWVKNHSTLSDGLYTVKTTAIVSGGSVVDTNMNALTVGGLNTLRNTISTNSLTATVDSNVMDSFYAYRSANAIYIYGQIKANVATTSAIASNLPKPAGGKRVISQVFKNSNGLPVEASVWIDSNKTQIDFYVGTAINAQLSFSMTYICE